MRKAVVLAVFLPLLLAGCGSSTETGSPPTVLGVAISGNPGSLEPGKAPDQITGNILYNISDPLVKLGAGGEAVPNLARSWDWSADRLTITFHLRDDGRWTNGDPVTAHDFEWSWKRLLSPELGADYAFQLFGVAGARAYNECASACGKLRDEVAIEAPDDLTLKVTLASPQPWFPQQVAHHSFLAVHRGTVEQFGQAWTEPENIVTNGPFELESWKPDRSVVLVKDPEWRNADQVTIERVVMPIIGEGRRQVRAFEADEIDATDGATPPPPEDIERLTASGDLVTYPIAGLRYYAFNTRAITDPNQRRAMALALDPEAHVEAAGFGPVPGSGFIPPGMPGFDEITGGFLEGRPDPQRARDFMKRVAHPKTHVTLYLNNAPDVERAGGLARDAWAPLGIRTRIKALEWGQYLETMGPPLDASVDVTGTGWLADYLDPYNIFDIISCRSESNWTNFCDETYEGLLRRARRTTDLDQRIPIYRKLEAILTGEDGLLPVAPVFWFADSTLEKPAIRETFNMNPLYYIDLSTVEPES